MKSLMPLFLSLLLFIVASCTDRPRVVYVERPAAAYAPPAYAEQAPPVFYSNCYVPNRGFLADNGRYYPDGATYNCNGMVYRSGSRYRGSLLGAFAIGYYYSSLGRGYGNYGGYHSNVTVVKNVTVINKGSSAYKSRMGRYNKIQKTRNKNKWVSKSEKKRRVSQSKRDKKKYQDKVKSRASARSKASKKNSSWGRSSKRSTRAKSNSNVRRRAAARKVRRPAPRRKSSSSWGRSSSRSSRSRSRSRSRKSDLRLKTRIRTIHNALYKVKKLRGVYFDYRHKEYDLNLSRKRQIGVIAQDVKKVLPEVVEVGEEGYYQVSYDKMVALLIEAVKEQQKQIDRLQNRCRH